VPLVFAGCLRVCVRESVGALHPESGSSPSKKTIRIHPPATHNTSSAAPAWRTHPLESPVWRSLTTWHHTISPWSLKWSSSAASVVWPFWKQVRKREGMGDGVKDKAGT